MGSYAYALIGVKLDKSKLFRYSNVPDCKHERSQNTKFCSECGKGTKEECVCILVPNNPDANIESSMRVNLPNNNRKYTLRSTTDNKEYFIGLETGTGNLEYPEKNSSLIRVDGKLIDELKLELKEFLTPFGLWQEDYFGVWSVGYYSY